jgi:hypothetical protein
MPTTHALEIIKTRNILLTFGNGNRCLIVPTAEPAAKRALHARTNVPFDKSVPIH